MSDEKLQKSIVELHESVYVMCHTNDKDELKTASRMAHDQLYDICLHNMDRVIKNEEKRKIQWIKE